MDLIVNALNALFGPCLKRRQHARRKRNDKGPVKASNPPSVHLLHDEINQLHVEQRKLLLKSVIDLWPGLLYQDV